MPDLSFQIEAAEAAPYAAAPQLAFKLRINNADPAERIHAIMLHGQIQIETNRRRYHPGEAVRLLDLFGEPERWGQTLRSMLWTITNTSIPSFSGSTLVDLPVPCTFDLNVAVAKYFYALENGEVPITILFSGTIFYDAGGEGLQVMLIPWEKEATFRLPVRVWSEMMEIYYPNSAWLCLQRDTFDRLYQYKIQQGLPTWEEALDRLLLSQEQEERRSI